MSELFSLQRTMADKNISLLLEQLHWVKGNYLIIADENWAQTNWADLANRCQCELHIISNRYDIAQQAEAAGLSVTFSDWTSVVLKITTMMVFCFVSVKSEPALTM